MQCAVVCENQFVHTPGEGVMQCAVVCENQLVHTPGEGVMHGAQPPLRRVRASQWPVRDGSDTRCRLARTKRECEKKTTGHHVNVRSSSFAVATTTSTLARKQRGRDGLAQTYVSRRRKGYLFHLFLAYFSHS